MTDAERWAYLAEGNAKQARKRVAADLLVRDQDGRVLLVNPTYKEDWDLPGGMAEANESPRAAAIRELYEELSLTTQPGRLLVLDWIPPRGPWDDQLLFVFDGGTLDPDQVAGLRISDPEVGEFAFLPSVDARARLRPDMAERLDRALHVLAANITTDYRESA